MKARQPLLFTEMPHRSPELQIAIDRAGTASAEERGAIFTQPEVVDRILDIADYTVQRDLARMRLLEPAFGQGDFLIAAISRLMNSFIAHGGNLHTCAGTLAQSICGIEVNKDDFLIAQKRIFSLLLTFDICENDAHSLVDGWLKQDDFLLTDITGQFEFVIGNPPYVRQERIPATLLQQYRSRYQTMYNRADLYIPFFERGLTLLIAGGTLVFICSDRWLTNKYGGPLRAFIDVRFYLHSYVRMHESKAFKQNVSAYPAIVAIKEGTASASLPLTNPDFSGELPKDSCSLLPDAIVARPFESVSYKQPLTHPWLAALTKDQQSLLQRLENDFPTLEAVGGKVGIGVATGCDSLYIDDIDRLPVEDACKLPLIMTADIRSGDIQWSGKGIINPFTATGKLVSLVDYPLLERYLMEHEAKIRSRHVAQKNPHAWYRTIDRIYPDLLAQPKLLLPDIALQPTVVYDEGCYYPHHNLYYIIAPTWDLRVLQALLSSHIARFFIAAYSTRIRGGYLRFQAQYLRRIRIPNYATISSHMRSDLIHAAMARDFVTINALASNVYQLNASENVTLSMYPTRS